MAAAGRVPEPPVPAERSYRLVASPAVRRTGGLVAAAVISLALACASAASAKDVTVTSFDGTKIVAHWFPGKGVDPDHPAPAILEGPGWSMAGDTQTRGDAPAA
jgi:hypothetical protein